MIRAAAKNHEWVTVVVDPDDYDLVLSAIANGGVDAAMRRKLAQIAFGRTAAYDAAVSDWLASHVDESEPPRRRSFARRLRQALRYGEKPHQQAAVFVTSGQRLGGATP